ncbi:hypothetical protein [Pseudomonas sp. CM27]|uniref:hypothetical protein n=1 Tax=Pseudomonas sp. CM27 TaxID=2738452 RepID=UPI0015532520|nr:hypothetical protein [Pseudomonas sp. CM27]NQD72911.1 hypothetical protein [Pseudomonas sp. CM27]
MSGAEDLARLTETIDKANELMLSDQIKMVDVGGGQQRPTNAKVLADLATQMSGALIYTSTALGLAGTQPGGYFSVISASTQEYLNLYRNESGTADWIATYPSALATQNADAMARTALSQTPPRSLDDAMPWAIVDEFFRAILGVKANGAVHAILDTLPGLDLLGDYAWAVVDSQGVVLLGIKWSGEVVTFGQSTGAVAAYADGPVGGQDIWVLVDGVPYQVTSSGDNFSPQVSSGRLSYIRRGTSVASVTVDVPVAGSVATFVQVLLHILGYGQSLSMGDTSVVQTTQPPTANRLLTIQSGVMLADQETTLTDAMVVPFKPLVSVVREVPVVQMSGQLNRLRGVPANAGLLTSAHGRNGRTIAQLSKGSLYYSNLLTAVASSKAEAARLGLTYRVPFVDWIQGEADRNMAQATYLAALLQLQSDLDTDIRAASGQSEPVPMLLDQISNFTNYGLVSSFVPLAQLQAALDYPDRFACAGPKYWVPSNTDGTHLTGDSYTRIGCMHMRAAEALIRGGRWLPTHAISAIRTDAVVVVRFHTPSGPLTVDTGNVSDPGNWGIRYVDDASSASVSKVRLLGENLLEVTLSAVPTGANPYIGIADAGIAGQPLGPTTGARACLRDNSPDRDGQGRPVYNWACHQRIAVQAA